jgi:hypothetical protein
VGLPWVCTQENHEVGVFDVGGDVTGLLAKELSVHPEIARLFLCKGCVNIGSADGFAQRSAIHAPEMIPLTTASIVGNRAPPVSLLECVESFGDIAYRHLPRHGFEAFVWLPL